MDAVMESVGKGEKVVDLKTVRMAKPKMVYENRRGDIVDYLITDGGSGFITNSGTAQAGEYEDIIRDLGVLARGWQRMRIDINPFVIKTDFIWLF